MAKSLMLQFQCAMCGKPFEQLVKEMTRYGTTLEDSPVRISDCDDYKRVRCNCSGRSEL